MEESALLHWHQEEPFLSASIYLQWCVMRLAHEHRTTVLIDGQGADELLAGYQFYFSAWQLDRLDRGEVLTGALDTVRFNRRLRRVQPRLLAEQPAIRRPDRSLPAEVPDAVGADAPCKRGRTPSGVPPAEPGFRLRRQLAESLQYNCCPLCSATPTATRWRSRVRHVFRSSIPS